LKYFGIFGASLGESGQNSFAPPKFACFYTYASPCGFYMERNCKLQFGLTVNVIMGSCLVLPFFVCPQLPIV